jgi:muramoyltetrapeptide carboxypeptidase LdcA involved in peptidoglycan recycling
MKILVIEDDTNPDYNDIERCLPKLAHSDVKHIKAFDAIETLHEDDYALCITDTA